MEIATLIQGILGFFFSVFSLFIADTFSRKRMLQWVCWIMCTSLLISCFQIALVETFGILGKWINLVSLIVYIGLTGGFLMGLTLVTATEIASTSTDVRGIILSACQIWNCIVNGIYTSIFPFVSVSLPLNYVLLFPFINLMILSYLVSFVPETVGKALHKCDWEEEKEQEEQLFGENGAQDDHKFESDTKRLLSL